MPNYTEIIASAFSILIANPFLEAAAVSPWLQHSVKRNPEESACSNSELDKTGGQK